MANVTGTIPNFIQGVSQQPGRDRLPGQCQEQLNWMSDPVSGLVRRPGLEYVDTIYTLATSTIYDKLHAWHNYDNGTGERYFLHVTPSGAIRVWGSDGSQKTVYNNCSAYLASAEPRKDIAFTTIGDTTFLLNKTVTTAKIDYPTGNYYNIILSGVACYPRQTFQVYYKDVLIFSHTNPAATHSDIDNYLRPEYVASIIRSGLILVPAFMNDFYIWRSGGTLLMYPKSESVNIHDFKFLDGHDNEDWIITYDSVKSIGDLPRYSRPNTVIKVTGYDSTSRNDRFFIAESTGIHVAGAFYEVSWKESFDRSEGTRDIIYSNSMPVALVRNGDGTFTCSYRDYFSGEEVGTNETAPIPSFIGSTLTDIGVFQNRLYLTSDTGVWMSKTNDFAKWTRETMSSVLDTDPIGVGVSLREPANIKRTASVNGHLLLLSDRHIFMIRGDIPITPATASMKLVSQVDASLTYANPISVGSSVYTTGLVGDYTQINEIAFLDDSGTTIVNALTAHVPKYILNSALQIASDKGVSTLAVLTEEQDRKIWVCQYNKDQDGYNQIAWHTWQLPTNIYPIYMTFWDSYLYLVYQDLGLNLKLGRFDMKHRGIADFEYNLCLDCLEYGEGIPGIEGSNTVSFTSNHNITRDGFMVIDGATNDTPGIETFGTTGLTDFSFEMSDSYGTAAVWGYRFDSEYELPTLYVRDNNNQAISSGILKLSRIALNYESTGYLAVDAILQYRGTYTTELTNLVAGHDVLGIGLDNFASGTMIVPLRCKNDEARIIIRTDSQFPANIVDLDWDGQFTPKGRRV